MRGTYGDTIQALEARRDILSTVAEGQRPPGGKPLERLLLLLASKGYAELATAAVESAVTEKATKQYLARIKGYPAGSEKPAGGKGKKSSEKSASAESIANEYLAAAGPPTGPPGGPGPQWRNLGPYTIPNGQTYGSSRISVSGRVAAIAVDPGNHAHVLCGAANGGVWESFNRGGSWITRTDYAATTAVGAIAFDPSNPATVYCGTGEGNWWSWLGTGILRSTDRGATWTSLCTNPFVGQGFYDLKVSPANRHHLPSGPGTRPHFSEYAGGALPQTRDARTWSIPMSPSPPAQILAPCSDGLWRATVGGSTWARVAFPCPPG